MRDSHASRCGGQAAPEYVGVLLVVALVLGGVAAVVSPSLASAVAGGIREGVCRVAGGVCSPDAARRAGLSACVVHARGVMERARVQVSFVVVGRDDAFRVERRSDGTARVSFLDGLALGGELAVGLTFSPLGLREGASAQVGARFTAGSTWDFRSAAAAERFMRRWAGEEDLRGELAGGLRRRCPFCGDAAERRAPPVERYLEGGPVAELRAELGLPGAAGSAHDGQPHSGTALDGHLRAGATGVLGRRVRGNRTTWYVQADAELAARLGVVIGAVRGRTSGTAVLELAVEDGRAVELRARASGQVGRELSFLAATTRLPELGRRLSGAVTAGRGGGLGVEAEVALDLRDEANRRAAEGVLDLLAPGTTPVDVHAAARALGARLDADGAIDLQTYLLRDVEEASVEAGVHAGGGIGASYERTGQVRELLQAWSLRHGGTLREREDCERAVAA